MKLSVVIPAYNEQDGISHVLDRLRQAATTLQKEVPELQSTELVVVDDGSSDETPRIVSQTQGVRLVRHPRNLGYGAALKTGFAACHGQWIAFLDADGTYPPEHLGRLLREGVSTGADMVVASRMAHKREAMPVVRWIGNRLYAALVSRIVGQRITDPCSGLRLFRCESLERLQPLPDGLDLTPAMTTRALHERLRVVEVPVPYGARAGESKLNSVLDGVRFLWTILEVATHYNPLRFFGALGSGLLGLGVIAALTPAVFAGATTFPWLAIAALLAWGGISVVHYGALCSNVLSLLYGKEMRGADLLSRVVFRKSLMQHVGKIGVVLLLAGLGSLVAAMGGGQGTGWLLAGGFLSLVGAQLALGTSAIRVLSHARKTREQRPADGSSGRVEGRRS